MPDIEKLLLEKLTKEQADAVKSTKRRVLVVAGAGSGKTEVMARRIAWWIGVNGVSKDQVVAFTFTERAAEEMKFRIRGWLEKITPAGEEVSLGGMYIGTIHGYCLAKIREHWPNDYHNFDILDESARTAFILRGFNGLLGLQALRQALNIGQYATIDAFTQAYDQLHEHNLFNVMLPEGDPPIELGQVEAEWCKQASLITPVGDSVEAKAFGVSAARYYAYLRCRRFLDFSTSQGEFIRRLESDQSILDSIASKQIHLVVDEVQDINPVQRKLMELLVGDAGRLIVVGDHRQSIYGFRGAKVEIIGELWEAFNAALDSEVIDLKENFRSTPRVIDLANRWSETIGRVRSMETPAMKHGNSSRLDHHRSHLALIGFEEREQEAHWIADAIRILAPPEDSNGAQHDKRSGGTRGLTLSDIAILVRSSTDVRTYMQILESAGIPSIVRAGPDLFSQPEVMLFVACLAMTGGQEEFIGNKFSSKSMPRRIESVLHTTPEVETTYHAAADTIRRAGLSFGHTTEQRLLAAAKYICARINDGQVITAGQANIFRTRKLREFITSRRELRRVFPQQLFHMLLSEAEVEAWDTDKGRGQTALFHLGALSSLITGLETPGWTSARDYKWQIIGLCQYGAEEGRAESQPLLVQPDAVNISTIHGVKGLEYAAVFLADVCAQRFPSGFASREPKLPLDGPIVEEIDVPGLADNENKDAERRLMYVAVTRAERFLFISHSGSRTSKFIKELKGMVYESGGLVTSDSELLLKELLYSPKEHLRDYRLSTSFSDLRYYLECPHDFYLRKVIGFAPTIDQAFGYGRGVHNLMRAIHAEPKKWAELADNRTALESELQKLIDSGLFYLRYTTGDPARNMRDKGLRIAADYVERYAKDELSKLNFEPEKEFETLIEYEDSEGGALISGAIDVIRGDDPPRVTLIDFKSGDPDSDKHQQLDEEEMQLQVALYAIAAKKELEFQPELGLVRYLDASDKSKSELAVPLDQKALEAAKKTVSTTAANIRDRKFDIGPSEKKGGAHRCKECDFLGICGMKEAASLKQANPSHW
jgi:ATP-dependent DNA helicase UvrD/PcrA